MSSTFSIAILNRIKLFRSPGPNFIWWVSFLKLNTLMTIILCFTLHLYCVNWKVKSGLPSGLLVELNYSAAILKLHFRHEKLKATVYNFELVH